METFLFIVIFIIVATFAFGAISAAPWVPTRKRERERVLKLFGFREGEKVYDLGAGDGAVLFSVAEREPSVRAVGYEVALLPLLFGHARKIINLKKYRNVSLRWGDLFRKDLRDADTVFVFLLESCYPRLIEKFNREIKDEARVIVMAWPLPGLEPVQSDKEEGTLSVYRYEGRQFR